MTTKNRNVSKRKGKKVWYEKKNRLIFEIFSKKKNQYEAIYQRNSYKTLKLQKPGIVRKNPITRKEENQEINVKEIIPNLIIEYEINTIYIFET